MVRRAAVLASLAVLVTAAPAGASTAHGVTVDPCRPYDVVTFTAGAGEVNQVAVGSVWAVVQYPAGFMCTDLKLQVATINDPRATIRPSGTCRFTLKITNRSVTCRMDELSVSLGDRNDQLVVAAVDAPRTSVSCGPGNDVVVGPVSSTEPDCETVIP